MQPPNHHSRINHTELKAQLIKRLGPERSKQYFHYLNNLLSLKLSKVEFNKKLVQHHQETLGKADNGRDVLLPNHELKGSVNDFPSEDGTDQSEVLFVKDGKESCARSSLQAPLGVPLFSMSISGTRRALPLASSTRYAKSYDIGGLLKSEALRERMQQIASLEGLEDVSMDCANILNNGLDVYLKRLIRMTIELVGTRHECSLRKSNTTNIIPVGILLTVSHQVTK
ncbi:putative Glucose-6-phosphate 1-epimerase [Hibiscus syriacus]|uniref:Glucose-6-phosphate 1-epimerase n=1 Tax=Hibiscus syriacus TaxID=106335 RepID=A0A6A2XFV0_HIBSY|nr:putative Glucose-6-phosphate 1-epimerase [Hibiscus syriacus]